MSPFSSTAIDELLSTDCVCQQSGASYRQIDYWTREGILTPAIAAEGSGTQRRWSPEVIPKVRAMATFSRLEADRSSTSTLLRLMGSSEGPWIVEDDGVRVTVEVVE